MPGKLDQKLSFFQDSIMNPANIFRQLKGNQYFYMSGPSGPFWVVLKLL